MAPLLTFYGDDFTGSSAVMEVLSFAGVPTMLFMEVPDAGVLAQYPDLKAIGVAGVARAKSPEWMRSHLPPVFESLKQFGAPLAHYKVCSTFDSAPEIGSIGTAAEIGADVFDPDWIPLVVGAPAIGRYQVFGNLFAAASDGIHRLDRHPVMSRHPVTPMDEADLGLHLSQQTDLPARIIALDAMDDASLQIAGALMWDESGHGFAVGSQGVEYALVAHWRDIGVLPKEHDAPRLQPVDQLFAVTGSCAPTTATQIEMAQANGFDVLTFDAAASADETALNAAIAATVDDALSRLSDGRDVLVTTAKGPDDPSVARMAAALDVTGVSAQVANERLGHALGTIVAEVRTRTGLQRVAIGGGDTSGHALTALKAEALSAVAPLAPGAPLCRIHSLSAPAIDGLEVTLKGGQMGPPDFFIHAKTGVA